MSTVPEQVTPNNNPYPRDVTSPGPVQRRVVISSQRVGNARPVGHAVPQKSPKNVDNNSANQSDK